MSLSRLPSLSNAAADVRAAIGQAARRTGVDFSYLVAQAQSESGLNPTAKAANSSATGLYQFLDQTWLGVVKQHGAAHGLGWAADAIQARPGGGFRVDPGLRDAVFALREQAGPASLMAAAHASDNAEGLGRALGREVNGTDLYFAHFLGLDGARRFLRAAGSNPDACAAAMFPREAQANRSIFYERGGDPRSLAEVYALMGRKLDTAGMAGGGAVAAPIDAGAVPGSLQPIPPGSPDADIRLAYADMSDPAVLEQQGSAGSTLAALEANRVNVLRPTPAQARLAYLMLSMPTA